MDYIPKLNADGYRYYGAWAGKAGGYREDRTCCAWEVARGMLFAQCIRKRGHGVDGLLCKQHAAIEAKQKAKGV
jgi:hypothetical protein